MGFGRNVMSSASVPVLYLNTRIRTVIGLCVASCRKVQYNEGNMISNMELSVMDIIRIVIKSASGYGPLTEAYEDKLTITSSSISYEYKPHPMSESETNIYRKWSYRATSPLFKEL